MLKVNNSENAARERDSVCQAGGVSDHSFGTPSGVDNIKSHVIFSCGGWLH
jgi:hypothetical protein